MAPPSQPPTTTSGEPEPEPQQQQQQRRRWRQAAAAAWEAALPASESQAERLERLEAALLLLEPTAASVAVAAGAGGSKGDAAYNTSSQLFYLLTQPPPTPSSSSSSAVAAAGGSLLLPSAVPLPPNHVGAHRQRVEQLLALIALEEDDEKKEHGAPQGPQQRKGAVVVPSDRDALAGAVGWYAAVLEAYAAGLGAVLGEVSAALGNLDEVAKGHESVAGRAESLHRTCEALLAEQHALEQRRALLAGPMDFFNELERLGPMLLDPTTPSGGSSSSLAAAAASPFRSGAIAGGGGAGGLLFVRAQPGSEEFAEALGRIDHAISFFQSHPHYKDSGPYLLRMRALQRRGLGLVRQAAISLIEGAARAALATTPSQQQEQQQPALEVSPIYHKFRAIAPRVHALVELITARLLPPPSPSMDEEDEGEEEEEEVEEEHRAALVEMVEEIHKTYTHQRWRLLKPLLRAHLDKAAATAAAAQEGEGGPTHLLRTGAAVLSRLCQLEAQLYAACFSPSNSEDEEEDTERDSVPRPYRAGSQQYWKDGSLLELLRGLCSLLHERVRPLVIHEGDLDRLCQLVNVVRGEILEGLQATPFLQGESGLALEGVLDRVAKDAQERLIYAAERVLRVDVEGFRPQASDLAYPQKLQEYWARRLSTEGSEGEGGAHQSSKEGGSKGQQQRLSTEGKEGQQQMPPVYATWFPTLHMALTLLAKLYRAVEAQVFQAMAQQALAACNESLSAAARLIREQKGGGNGDELDADLFLVKHLLILREQLVPFDVEFAAVERRLDFQSTRGALSKFLQERGKQLFRAGAAHALLSLAVDAVPTVNEEEVDSKRQLEEALKRACNNFILHGTEHLAAPLSSLLSKARAFVPEGSERDGEKMKTLVEQDFMGQERLEAALLQAHECLTSSTPDLLERMALYLDHNSATRAVLFKPVRLRVLHVLSQLRDLLQLALLAIPSSAPAGPPLLPPAIDGPLSAMRACLSRALEGDDGGIGNSGSGLGASLSSTGCGGGAAASS